MQKLITGESELYLPRVVEGLRGKAETEVQPDLTQKRMEKQTGKGNK